MKLVQISVCVRPDYVMSHANELAAVLSFDKGPEKVIPVSEGTVESLLCILADAERIIQNELYQEIQSHSFKLSEVSDD